MSVCGASRLVRLLRRRQWRGRGGRATAGGGFSQGNYAGFIQRFIANRRSAGSRGASQLLSSALIRLSNSSKEVSPLIISPLMKKVGVEFTFKTSEAYFWSAAILSSSA